MGLIASIASVASVKAFCIFPNLKIALYQRSKWSSWDKSLNWNIRCCVFLGVTWYFFYRSKGFGSNMRSRISRFFTLKCNHNFVRNRIFYFIPSTTTETGIFVENSKEIVILRLAGIKFVDMRGIDKKYVLHSQSHDYSALFSHSTGFWQQLNPNNCSNTAGSAHFEWPWKTLLLSNSMRILLAYQQSCLPFSI